MAPSHIRLAILEADSPLGNTRAKYGSYGGVFTSLLYKAADASNIPRETLEITGWDVVNAEGAKEGEEEDMGGDFHMKRKQGYPKMQDIDAILITGSRTSTPSIHPFNLPHLQSIILKAQALSIHSTHRLTPPPSPK